MSPLTRNGKTATELDRRSVLHGFIESRKEFDKRRAENKGNEKAARTQLATLTSREVEYTGDYMRMLKSYSGGCACGDSTPHAHRMDGSKQMNALVVKGALELLRVSTLPSLARRKGALEDKLLEIEEEARLIEVDEEEVRVEAAEEMRELNAELKRGEHES